MKKYLQILMIIFHACYAIGQTDQTTRKDIREKKIKVTRTLEYSMWDRNAQKPSHEALLQNITVEYYDTLGNLVSDTNETTEPAISLLMNFRNEYTYDAHGNCVSWNPLGKKMTYQYDTAGRKIMEVSFDLHGEPFQTRYYFYDNSGKLILDSLYQQGKPLFITNYTYIGGKLVEKVTRFARKVVIPVNSDTRYSYNRKGDMEKEESFFNGSSDYKIPGHSKSTFKYDDQHRLLKEIVDGKITEYTYDAAGNVIKRYVYDKLPVNKYSYKVPNYFLLEYQFY